MQTELRDGVISFPFTKSWFWVGLKTKPGDYVDYSWGVYEKTKIERSHCYGFLGRHWSVLILWVMKSKSGGTLIEV